MEKIDVRKDIDLKNLIHHITDCLTEGSTGAIQRTLTWAQQATGFEYAITCRISDENGHPVIHDHINHSFDPAWIKLYMSEGYSKIDPVLTSALTRTGIYDWQLERTEPSFWPKHFSESAKDYGFQSGLASSFQSKNSAFPHNRTICSLVNVDVRQRSTAAYIMETLAPVFHSILSPCTAPAVSHILLSNREMDILQWARQGKNVWDISMILAISESTVKFHLQNIYRKLNVGNRAHAIARATQLGLI